MIYTQEYKQKCFNVLRYSNVDVSKVMSALDAGNDTLVRYALEVALDDEELYDKTKVADDGERIVLNAKIHAFKQRQEIYSEFMEQYTTVLDGQLQEA